MQKRNKIYKYLYISVSDYVMLIGGGKSHLSTQRFCYAEPYRYASETLKENKNIPQMGLLN